MDDMTDRFAFAESLRVHRERAGMSRAVLASLANCSPESVKKWETGERGIPQTRFLARLALALGLTDIRELTGGPVGMPVTTGYVHLPVIDSVKSTVRTIVYAPVPARAPEPLELEQRIDAAWRIWHASPYQRTQAGELIPRLITDVHAAVRLAATIETRRKASASMTQLYALTQLLIGYVCEADLYWTVADRVQMAARDADDPVSLGLAAWCHAVGLRYTADPHESITMATDAINELTPFATGEDTEVSALIGALHLHAATSFAQDGHAGDAWRHWDQADSTASRLPDGYWHRATVFSRQNVRVHAVAIGAELSRMGDALGHADQIDPDEVPSTERASRLLIDSAKAYHHRGETAAAVSRLQAALRRGPENTRVIPAARSLVLDLVAKRPASLASEVNELAEKMGVLSAA
jgi:transcriptional regulator with XRE-family HTH domain